jgi:hypothetical protein
MNTENKLQVEREVKNLETIEFQGKKIISTFNDKFDKENTWLIELLKRDERAINDYGYLYLKLLEFKGIITINYIPKKIISTEVLGRLRRHLFTLAREGHPDLKFLLPYDKETNKFLELESDEYWRNN